jgi:uncharacterized membrane protein YfcA
VYKGRVGTLARREVVGSALLGLLAGVLSGLLGAGGIVGALLGSRIALAVPAHTLRMLFVVYLVIMGLRMAWPRRGPERGEAWLDA